MCSAGEAIDAVAAAAAAAAGPVAGGGHDRDEEGKRQAIVRNLSRAGMM